MSSDESHLDEAINETPKRGPFLSSADAKRTWQCPLCDHTLRYSAGTRDVAEMAANSHVSRQHKGEKLIVILPDDAPPSHAGTISMIWQCPFCDTALRVPEDEYQRGLTVHAHLVQKHRYHTQDVEPECQVTQPSGQTWQRGRQWTLPKNRRWTPW